MTRAAGRNYSGFRASVDHLLGRAALWVEPPFRGCYETCPAAMTVEQTARPSRRDSISKPSVSTLGRLKWKIQSPLQRTAHVS